MPEAKIREHIGIFGSLDTISEDKLYKKSFISAAVANGYLNLIKKFLLEVHVKNELFQLTKMTIINRHLDLALYLASGFGETLPLYPLTSIISLAIEHKYRELFR